MGVFDYLICKYPLPVDGAGGAEFQTKDTPAQWLDHYEIREDGSLWYEAHDIEDRSDPNAEGILALCGSMSSVNKRWVPEKLTGEIVFYGNPGEFSAYFVDGKIKYLTVLGPQSSPADGQSGG